jgi:hypothetical protein
MDEREEAYARLPVSALKTITIVVEEDVAEKLRREAYEQKVTLSAIIADALALKWKDEGVPASLQRVGRRRRGRPPHSLID